jgi:hypothetical protein
MWEPQSQFLRLATQLNQLCDIRAPIGLGDPLGFKPLLGRRHDLGDKGADLPADLFEFG